VVLYGAGAGGWTVYFSLVTWPKTKLGYQFGNDQTENILVLVT
jgi:hypothetical protein